jgi:hypothetical protein
MSKYLRPVIESDIKLVAENIRPADRDECLAAAGASPELALWFSIKSSEQSYTLITPEGAAAGICGIAAGQGADNRMVWMLGTPLIERHARLFVRESHKWLDTIPYLLWNRVDTRNTKHVKWLHAVGAKFHDTIPSPYTGTPLIFFTRTSHVRRTTRTGHGYWPLGGCGRILRR